MDRKKRGFFERLTGSLSLEEEIQETKNEMSRNIKVGDKKGAQNNNWMEEENDEAELTVDVYQTPSEMVIQTMVAGVKPEDIDISVSRDVITIRGKREESRTIDEENYFAQELYWGKFSRTISLPAEVEPEEVEATEKHGLLTIKVKKVDKGKKSNIRVKSI